MFNMRDIQDMGKLFNEAKEVQRQQDSKHREQMNVLNRIASTLEGILEELKRGRA